MTLRRAPARLVRKALLAALVGLAAFAAPAAAQEPFLGEVQIVGFTFCPRGFAQMNGQLLPINQNQALFQLLGTTYGGNGQTTFALPTAKPTFTATGAPLLYCIALQGIFPSRPD
jgi:microcystin-dependent protein